MDLLSNLERVGDNKIKTYTLTRSNKLIQHHDKSVNLIEMKEDGVEIHVVSTVDLMKGLLNGKPLQNRKGIKRLFFFDDETKWKYKTKAWGKYK